MSEMISAAKTRCIYVVVTSTGTSVAKAIRVVTKMPYSHVSVTNDPSLRTLYSFSRNYRLSPLPASFNTEFIGEGTFGKFSNIPCEIYEIPLSEEYYQQFQLIIAHFIKSRKEFSYSLLGLLYVKMQIEKELRTKFVCSQFVAYVLDRCGVKLPKPPSIASPDDLRYIPEARLIYRGELNRYYQEMSASMRPITSAV